MLVRPVGMHEPDPAMSGLVRSRKADSRAVRGPSAGGKVRVTLRERMLSRSVSVHFPDAIGPGDPAAASLEEQPTAVGRPDRNAVGRGRRLVVADAVWGHRVPGQQLRAVIVKRVDGKAVAGGRVYDEGDLRSVRRPGRL